MKRPWLLTILALIPLTSIRAQVVAEREVVLRNGLRSERQNELVCLTMAQLGVAAELEMRIRSAEATDAGGTALPCQFDPFGQVPGFRSEVSLLVTLRPLERRVIRIKLTDQRPRAAQPAVSLKRRKDGLTVETKEFEARVTNRSDGLWFHGVKMKGKESDERLRSALGEVEDELGDIEGPLSPAPGPKPTSSEALAEGGLGFAFNGFRPFGGAEAELRSWSGPVRAVVTLFDRGPWRVAKRVIPCESRQTMSIPARGTKCLLTCELRPHEPVERARFSYGALRIDSWSHPWRLALAQKGRPPRYTECPEYVLEGKGKLMIDPELIRPSLSHGGARLSAKGRRLVLAVDQTNPSLPLEPNWSTGQLRLNGLLLAEDGGPHRNTLQCLARPRRIQGGRPMRFNAAVRFGAEGKATRDIMDAFVAQVNDSLAVPHIAPDGEAEPVQAAALQELVKTRDVVVVRPDNDEFSEEATDLAQALGGSCRRASSFLRFVNVVKAGPPLLIVPVGTPGVNAVLDQLNGAQRVFDPYPLKDGRTCLTICRGTRPEDAALLVSGATAPAVGAAAKRVAELMGDAVKLPALSVSGRAWAARMPFPWAGRRDSTEPIHATAWPGGHADFLLMLRANEPISELRIKAPEGYEVRSVQWFYGTPEADSESIVPKNDAAFPGVPDKLAPDRQLALWLSRKLGADAASGEQRAKLTILHDGRQREVELVLQILSVPLAGGYPVGFYPMGAGRDMLQQYFQWSEEEYLEHLPALLRQMAEFGANAYELSIYGLKITADKEGTVNVDAEGLRRELAAVREAATVELLLINSPHHLRLDRLCDRVAQQRGLATAEDAWDGAVAPAIRKALADLGLAGRIYCRHGDEIGDYERWLYPARKYKRAGLNLTVCVNGYGVMMCELAVGTMDLWIPQYPFYVDRLGREPAPDEPYLFSRHFRDQRRAAGEPIWPYVCGLGPYMWSARPRSQGRYLISDVYMKKGQGLVYYGGMVWSHAFLSTAARRTQRADLLGTDCTFVSLFYPDPATNRLVPSLRLAAMRQGLDDAAAMAGLRARAAARGQGEQAEARILSAWNRLDSDAGQADFDTFRLAVDRINRTVQ